MAMASRWAHSRLSNSAPGAGLLAPPRAGDPASRAGRTVQRAPASSMVLGTWLAGESFGRVLHPQTQPSAPTPFLLAFAGAVWGLLSCIFWMCWMHPRIMSCRVIDGRSLVANCLTSR